MAWIKRNKFFVIAMVVGLACIGYCGYLFAANLSSVSAKDAEYTSNLRQYKSLMSAPLYPSEQNTAGAKQDITNVQELLTNYRKAFVSFPPPPKMTDESFKAYLGETIHSLGVAATNAGVTLPDAFPFGFTMQLKQFNYPPDALQPWMQQLAEIKAIFAILYQARINSVEIFQRVKISYSDDGPGSDFFDASKVTNSPLVSTPYKMTFRAFGPELAAVLDGLAQSSNCFIVKTLQVEKAYVPDTGQDQMVEPQPTAAPIMNREENPGGDMNDRRSSRRVPTQATTETQAPTVRRVPRTVLSEGLLRVTIAIDAVQNSGGSH
jgi:hypothetical protein